MEHLITFVKQKYQLYAQIIKSVRFCMKKAMLKNSCHFPEKNFKDFQPEEIFRSRKRLSLKVCRPVRMFRKKKKRKNNLREERRRYNGRLKTAA